MTPILIPMLSFVAVAAIGGGVLMARHARRSRLRVRLEAFGDVALDADHQIEKAPLGPTRFLEALGRLITPKAGDGALSAHLAHAGYFTPSAVTVYMGLRLLGVVTGLIIAGSLAAPANLIWPVKLMITLGGGFVLSLVPSLYVDLKRSARTTEIQHHLPDAVDLLEICVSAGMGLDMAWNAVTDEIRRVSNTLADEMALTNLEIHLGADRATAMRHMADRTGSRDINSLVGTLVQSERFGTPISEALRVFAESMRDERHTRAAESAEKMGVKMLFPMIAFILPSILVVMGGAAIIKIMEMFDSL